MTEPTPALWPTAQQAILAGQSPAIPGPPSAETVEPTRRGAVLTMHYVEGWLSNDFPEASRYLREHLEQIADQMVEDQCAADDVADPPDEPCCDEGMTCLECDPDATFAEYADMSVPPATTTKSSGEVVDLLAALQRSVDAAKSAREERPQSGGDPS